VPVSAVSISSTSHYTKTFPKCACTFGNPLDSAASHDADRQLVEISHRFMTSLLGFQVDK
jgi:hypothetical protein